MEKRIIEQELAEVGRLTTDADTIVSQTSLTYNKVIDRCEEMLKSIKLSR